MSAVMRVLDAVDRGIGRVEWFVTILLMSAIVVAIGLGVFYRYVLGASLTWSNEVGILALVWLSVIGASALYKERGHIAVDALSQVLPESIRRAIAMLSVVLIGCAMAIIAWKMLVLIPMQHRRMIVGLDLPRSYYGLPLLWMAASMTFTSILHLLRDAGLGPDREH